MSPLARWCHRHRLAVVLVWVGLLLALGAGAGAAGSAFGNSPTSQNTDSARATALLQRASDSAAGKSGRVVWQVDDGRVTDPTAEKAMAGHHQRHILRHTRGDAGGQVVVHDGPLARPGHR
ncbi:hypothetical protein ACWDAQ_22650, partial [Streptomyces sp. NPDC001139]